MPTLTATDPKPLYAVAGAADLAAAALRELPAYLPTIASRAEAAALNARARISETSWEALRGDLPERLRAELPAEVQRLRAELPKRLREAQAAARQYYAELVTRGEGTVARFRRDHADTIEAVTAKVADAAEKAAGAADKVAGAVTDVMPTRES